MKKLDLQAWYTQLGERKRFEMMEGDPREYEVDSHLRRITDPNKMDRIMCRVDSVAECKNAQDLDVAHYNGRVVLEIDPACPNDTLFKKIKVILEHVRDRSPRKLNTRSWAEHRILALYDLKLMGYDLSKERKQLSLWLFPEIEDEKARGDKYDRATELLASALNALPTLRAQANG
jgi:uncharacterized protein (UPF0128 family)